jgi:hypothetical protein
MNEKQPIVGDLTAIPAAIRRQHLAAIPEIFQAVQRVQELPDGFAFQFHNQPGRFMALANFIEYEQLRRYFHPHRPGLGLGSGRMAAGSLRPAWRGRCAGRRGDYPGRAALALRSKPLANHNGQA